MVERITSGIPGLDEAVSGGIPEGSVTLVTGGPGSGKTTFCSQFLWDGLQQGDTCLFITMEELPNEIREDAQVFGWDFDDVADAEFKLFYVDPATRTEQTAENIEKAVEQVDPDRVVIDSISVLEAYWGNEREVRANVHEIVKSFRRMDLTAVVTAEAPDLANGMLTRYGIAEYVVDGVIVLGGLRLGQSTFRSLQVIKMRKTQIEEDVLGLSMTGNGLVIEESETL